MPNLKYYSIREKLEMIARVQQAESQTQVSQDNNEQV